MFRPDPKPVKALKKDLHTFASSMTKLAKRKPLKKVSKVRAKELKTYGQKRKDFLESHKVCQARLIQCEGKAVDVHHSAGRNGKLLNDVSLFIALCRSCHDQIHNKLGAKELRDKRLKKWESQVFIGFSSIKSGVLLNTLWKEIIGIYTEVMNLAKILICKSLVIK